MLARLAGEEGERCKRRSAAEADAERLQAERDRVRGAIDAQFSDWRRDVHLQEARAPSPPPPEAAPAQSPPPLAATPEAAWRLEAAPAQSPPPPAATPEAAWSPEAAPAESPVPPPRSKAEARIPGRRAPAAALRSVLPPPTPVAAVVHEPDGLGLDGVAAMGALSEGESEVSEVESEVSEGVAAVMGSLAGHGSDGSGVSDSTVDFDD